ncbi:hypothetical protein I316_00730 [Kwoniella heveanensis BCC8398]|uniref:Uncharacterized protein n=1 Tax=Kwoniella heveanensis BCC8398 TaxID=1296120 RepID=A0A1B9H2V4_9TREE|nr:hypothetical protein I316_00730 [Kwoniella heveanensis BCC8398]
MDPPTYAPLPKLSIQAGLFSALPVSRDPSPLPIPTSRPVSRAIPLSFGATSNPNSASFSASDTSLSPYHAASSGQNLDVDVEMKDRSRRRSFNGLGFSFRSTSRSMSKSHGSRASISSFISIAASACAPRSGLEPAASANGLAPEPAPACSSIETSTSAIHIDESFGLDGRMEIDYQSRRGSLSNSRVGSAVPALAPDPAQTQADDVQSSLRAFRFPSTDAGGAQVQGKGRSKNGEKTHSQNVIHSQKNGDNPQNHSRRKWNERKMDVTLKIKIDGHQTSIHGPGGPQHHQHHHRHSHTAGLTSFSALSTSFPHPQQPYTAVPAHHGKQYSHASAVPYVYTPCTAASHSRTFHPRTPLTAVHGNMGNRWTSSNRQGGLGRGRYWSKLSRSLYIDFKVGKKRFRIRSDRSRNCHCAHEAYALASSGGIGTEGWAVTPGLKSGVGGGGRGKGRRRPRSVRRVSFGGYEVR